MDNAKVMHYFLGSNSEKGFYSLYDGLTIPEDGDFLWVIKGGPGCGKSSFMRILGDAAADAGLEVEYVHCSGDPHSLDAVRFPELKTAYVDGTSPHIIEAMYPGCSSLYLDLGAFYSACSLEGKRDEIIKLNREYKALYKRAYSYLAAAGKIVPASLYRVSSDFLLNKVEKRASGFISREMKPIGEQGKTRIIFLDAISCDGTVSFRDAMLRLYDKVCIIDNEYGLGKIYLEKIYAQALERGYDVIVSRCALCPDEISALFFPQLSLGMLALSKGENIECETYRHIRLDAIAEKELTGSSRKEFRESKKLQQKLISQSIVSLKQAKALHDELESIYNPHVDFASLYKIAEDHKSWLLGS